MTQRAIARECARVGAPKGAVPVEHDRCADAAVRGSSTTRAAYLPLQGFTSADLGYERGNAVSNMVTKLDEAPMTAQYVAALRPDLAQPRPTRGRDRGCLRAHRLGLRRELAGPHLLPDPLQPVRGVPRRHQRGRPSQRPDRLQGHGCLEEPSTTSSATPRPGSSTSSRPTTAASSPTASVSGRRSRRSRSSSTTSCATSPSSCLRRRSSRTTGRTTTRTSRRTSSRLTGSTTTCSPIPTCHARGASRWASRWTG